MARYGIFAVAALFLTTSVAFGQRAGLETCRRHLENQARATARAQTEREVLHRELGDDRALEALAQRVSEVAEAMSAESVSLAMVYGLEAFESARKTIAIRQRFSGRDVTQAITDAENRYRHARQSRTGSFHPSFPFTNRVVQWTATSSGLFAGTTRFERGTLSVEVQVVSEDFGSRGSPVENPSFIVQRLTVTIRRGPLTEMRTGIRILEVGSGRRLSVPPRRLDPRYPVNIAANEVNATEMLRSLRGGALSLVEQAGQWDHVRCRELLESVDVPPHSRPPVPVMQ